MTNQIGSIAELAGKLINARSSGGQVGHIEETALRDENDCYEVQGRVAAALGPVGAFKTARKPGQPQIMAPILAADVRRSPAVFGPDELELIGVELEVGFLVTGELPDPRQADFNERAQSRVAPVPVLEIVDTRYGDLRAAGPLARLADNQINGALVTGAPRSNWNGLDLKNVTARLKFGDETVLDGDVPVPGGDAYETFCAFARMVGVHCGGLRPGQFVITGSLNGLPFIERGIRIRGCIKGLGDVEADFPR